MNQKYIIGLIGSIREGYNKFLEKELDKKGITGLVSSHGAILSVLYKHNGTLPVLQIADLINRTKSTVTELIAKLEKNEYVIKKPNPDDKRSTLIELTKLRIFPIYPACGIAVPCFFP